MKNSIILIVLSLVVATQFYAQDCDLYTAVKYDSIEIFPDQYYGTALSFRDLEDSLFLDIYRPFTVTEDSFPLIVVAHPGGFYSGNRKAPSIVTFANEFASRGYVVASISYRLGFDRERDPVLGYFCEPYAYDTSELVRAIYRSVQDARGAIRYMKGQIEAYNIDTTKVIIAGESAGGFVALHTGYMKRPDEKPNETYAISNVVHKDVLGNTILNRPRPDLGDIEGTLNLNGTSSDVNGVLNIYGGLIDPTLVECGDPDLYMYHISDDPIVHCNVARAYNTSPSLCFPFTGVTKNPLIYGSCAIRNYIEDSLDCCDLIMDMKYLISNIVIGPIPHDYSSNNSKNIFFEAVPVALDSILCIPDLTSPILVESGDSLIIINYDEFFDYKWLLDDEPFLNDEPFWIPDENGSYRVVATSNIDCSESSETFEWVSTSSIGQELDLLSVYPVPTQSLIYLEADLEIRRVELIDLEGRKLTISMNDSRVLDLKEFAPGSYVLIVVSDNKSYTKKIIKI